MNTARLFLFCLLLCGSLPAVAASAPIAPQVFRIAYPDTENAPRAIGNSVDVPAQSPGITVELLQMVGWQLGIKMEFIRTPWRRCLYLVEQGGADAVFHASYKPERAEYGVYPGRNGELDPARAIYTGRYAVYIRKGSGVEWDGDAFHNAAHPFGAQLGTAGASDLDKRGYKVEEERSVRVNFDKLQAGRISAYVEIESIGESFLADHKGQYPEVVRLPIPFREKVYYLMISRVFYRQHPKLSEAIFDAIRDVKKQDAYKAMEDKYR